VRFFKKVYPSYQNEFSIINGVSLITINIAAAYTGGALGDHYDKRKPQVKSIIAGIGPLISFPFLIIAFIFSNNFWLSVILFVSSFFFAEMWMGTTVSMLQDIFPSQITGTAISVFLLSGGLAGAISNLLLGILNDHYVKHNR